MNKAAQQHLANYKDWVKRAKLRGTKLIAYNCPSCLEKLETNQAPKGVSWDTFSNCPFCQVLLFKVTKGDQVTVELIKNIGKEE